MSLSPGLRHQLEALIQAYDRGAGPVEQEARRRVAAGLPMTSVQIRAFAEACYPAEVRALLDSLGHQRLYEGDLGQALAVSVMAATPPTGHSPRPTAVHRPSDDVAKRPTGWARIAVLAMAVLVSGLILAAAFTRPPPERELPAAPAIDPGRSSARLSAPEESVCLRLLRASATAWCETALTGIAARDVISQAKLGNCGDRLAAGRDTVRLALDRILADDASDTYTAADAYERCAAAAKLAVPR